MLLGNVETASGTNDVPWYQSLFTTLGQAATTVLTIEQQRNLLKINEQRASQGLSPMDPSDYGLGVNVGVNRSTQNTLLMVGGGLAAVWLVSSLLKSRRR